MNNHKELRMRAKAKGWWYVLKTGLITGTIAVVLLLIWDLLIARDPVGARCNE